MIITNIIGGLGNQMFQYSAGRALALKLGVELKLDTRDFIGYELHQGFELDRLFNCCAEIANDNDFLQVLGWQRLRLVQRLLRRPKLKRFRSRSFVLEPYFNYWEGINHLKDNSYLSGYYQSEQYFSRYSGSIREDFTFKLPLLGLNAQIAEQMSRVNAVSIHLRRGDYVHDAKNAFIGTCSLDYYRTAIEKIKSLVHEPVFYVFSDDISWVKCNLSIDAECVYVDHNSCAESYNDMRLMSLCKHHIIANSSFSWWGAWLGKNVNKVVVAPKQWFAQGQSADDLIPADWLKL